MYLVIDIGNTRAKFYIYDAAQQCVAEESSDLDLKKLESFVKKQSCKKAIISTVIDLSPQALEVLGQLQIPIVWLKGTSVTPLTNLYQTPETLGTDRLAAAVGAYLHFPCSSLLVIDAGSCFTFDIIEKGGKYLGGNISPGLRMRLQAMHDYTHRLPLIREYQPSTLPGKNTIEAIQNGVFFSLKAEIEGYIQHYKAIYPDLKIIFTGGAALDFKDILPAEVIFDPYLVPQGLNYILTYYEEIENPHKL